MTTSSQLREALQSGDLDAIETALWGHDIVADTQEAIKQDWTDEDGYTDRVGYDIEMGYHLSSAAYQLDLVVSYLEDVTR